MADLMSEWLGRTIEKELGDALEQRIKGELNNCQASGQVGDITFVDDGSNLRIKSAKPRVVQISKFVTYKEGEPLQAVLSDSVNRIDATISEEAARRYYKKAKKRFTNGTVGGLIQLLDFEIVARDWGARPKRITLFVTKFETLGANGSGAYGVPQAVEDRPEVRLVAERLKEFREQEKAAKERLSTQNSPHRMSSLSSQPVIDHGSQAMFATQAPLSRVSAGVNGNFKGQSNGTGVGPRTFENKVEVSSTPDSSSQSTSGDQNEEHGPDKAKTLHMEPPQKKAVVGKKPAATTHSDLLSILRGATKTSNKKLPLSVSAPARADTIPSKVIASLPATKITTEQLPPPVPDAPSSPHCKTPTSPLIPGTTKVSLGEDQSRSNIQTKPSTIATSKKMRNRINGYDVKISKDQEALLNSRDSWLPAEPGRREPSANIPISILQSLNHKADSRAKKDAAALKKSNESSHDEIDYARRPIPEDNSDQEGPESEPGTPISASEWPPSPQPARLPPDSSMESPDTQSVPDVQLRRSSSASIAAKTLLSDSMSTPYLLTPSKKLKETSPGGKKSNGLSSPFIETTQSYERQEHDVGNPNKVSEDLREEDDVPDFSQGILLKDHVEQHRSENKPSHSSPCGSGECDNSDMSLGDLENHFEHENYEKGSRAVEVPVNSPRPKSPLSPPTNIKSNPTKAISPLLVNDLDELHEDALRNYASTQDDQGFHSPAVREEEPKVRPSLLDHLPLKECQFKRRRKSSNLYSIPSSPTSDLEMTVPIPLSTEPTIHRFPSTVSQPTEPFTQVKRTPYVNGQKRALSLPTPEGQKSPPNTSFSQLLDEDTPIKVDHVTQSAPIIIEKPGADTLADTIVEESSLGTSHSASLPLQADSSNTAPVGQVERPTIDQFSHKSDDTPMHDVTPVETTPPHASHSREQNGFSPEADSEIHSRTYDVQEMKRKAHGLEPLSPNVAKRRKKFKFPVALDYIEDLRDAPDPVEGAKRYRREFLASRRKKEASEREESSTSLQTQAKEIATIEADSSDLENTHANVSNPEMANLIQQPVEDHPPGSLGVNQLRDGDFNASSRSTQDFNLLSPQQEPDIPSRDLLPENDLIWEAGSVETGPEIRDPDMMDIGTDSFEEKAVKLSNSNANAMDLEGLSKATISEANPSPTTQECQINADLYSQLASPHSSVPAMLNSHNDQVVEAEKDPDVLQTRTTQDMTDFPSRNTLLAAEAHYLSPESTSPGPLLEAIPQPSESHLIGAAVLPNPNMETPIVESGVPTDRTTPQLALENADIYERLRLAYPAYPGDRKHFLAICKKIKNLLSKNRMEHPSLWDDFIVRHKTEYPQYVRRCAEEADDPLAYEDYYREEIEQPLYQQRLITQKTLDEALSLANPTNSQSIVRLEKQGFVPEHEPSTPALQMANRGTYHPKSSEGRVMIDLTENENLAAHHLKSKPRSNLSLTDSVDSSPVKKRPRPLPWTKHESIPNSLVSERTSSLHSSPDFLVRSQRGIPNHNVKTNTKEIQQHGGVTSNDVFDPDSYDIKNMTPRSKNLLGEISEMSPNIPEARKLIRKQIRKNTGSKGKGKVLTYEDLEAVKEDLRKRPSGAHRPPPSRRGSSSLDPTAQAPISDNTETEIRGWWQDDNTPFKNFMKAYKAIRPGNGNSFAKPRSSATEGDLSRMKKDAKRFKRIDPLNRDL